MIVVAPLRTGGEVMRPRVIRSILILLSLWVGWLAAPTNLGAQPAPAVPPSPEVLAFAETGEALSGAFLAYWRQHGALQQFGYPISPPLRDAAGRTIQWLERARFEYHADRPAGQRLLLGLVGHELTRERATEPAFRRLGDTGDGAWFAATGHTLRGEFRHYWEHTGGLVIYGYPLSEAFAERNPADGRVYTVQYFERSRFEWHPGLPERYRITIGLLGRQLYRGGGEIAPSPPDDRSTSTTGPSITAIGDSVMLGARPALQQRLPTIDVDAEVSRQLNQALEVARARRAAGTLGAVVVLHLGTNGLIGAAEFDRLIDALGEPQRVVVVTLKVPRAWEEPNNAMLRATVSRHPTVVLVDWHAASIGQPDYFWSDGYHLRPEGARTYAALIAAAVEAP
jgi:hypothetical protein